MNKNIWVTLLYYNASIFNWKFRKIIVTWILKFCLNKILTKILIKNKISSEKSFLQNWNIQVTIFFRNLQLMRWANKVTYLFNFFKFFEIQKNLILKFMINKNSLYWVFFYTSEFTNFLLLSSFFHHFNPGPDYKQKL